MATLSPAELLDWLAQHQFLSPAQADELRPLLAGFSDSMALAKELIRRDWLTPFQVNQIMTGKPEQLVLGDYRLRERIGEGAMGQVFKAVSLTSGRVVAVKTLVKELMKSVKAMERFRREIEAASHLDHPNIAHVLDAGEADGRPFLVMEFIEGIDLSKRVKRDGPLPIHEAVEFIRQAALGLQHAFACGIVHRDIKPGNLMVTTIRYNDQAMPVVKVLDFGLARFETEEDDADRLTQVGRMLGTIDYVAPEQATNARDADIRADIYSLGCSLYYLLTGKPPFPGKDPVEKLGPRVTGEPPWVRTQCPQAPPGLEEVLRKIMARRPEDRYQTPVEAASALAPYAVPSAPPAIALAQPVSSPAEGVVAMAHPVPGAAGGGVPMAMPVAAASVAYAPGSPPPAEESSFLGMTATGRDMSSGAAASAPRAVAKKPFPSKMIALIVGGVLAVSLLGCLGVCLLKYFTGPPTPTKGIVKITDAKWSMANGKAIPGKPHHVLVWIERISCKGPISVTLKDLPDGVTSGTLKLKGKDDRGQFGFIVSYGTDPLTKQVRLVAECEDGATDELPMTLTIVPDPNKKK